MATQTHPFAAERLLLDRGETLLFATLQDENDSIDDTGCQQQTREYEPYPTRTAFSYTRMRAYIALKSLVGVRCPYTLNTVFDLLFTAPDSPKSAGFIGITVDRIEGLDVGYWM